MVVVVVGVAGVRLASNGRQLDGQVQAEGPARPATFSAASIAQSRA